MQGNAQQATKLVLGFAIAQPNLQLVNLAIRYSDRLAMLKSGKLEAIGTPEAVITSERVEQVFGVKVVKISTPVGLQIYSIASNNK